MCFEQRHSQRKSRAQHERRIQSECRTEFLSSHFIAVLFERVISFAAVHFRRVSSCGDGSAIGLRVSVDPGGYNHRQKSPS